MFSIKKKLILLITSCTLFATILLGGISIIRISSIIENSSQNTIQLQCQATKETLDIRLRNISQAVDSMKDLILSELDNFSTLTSDANYRRLFTKKLETTNQSIAFHTRGTTAYYFWYNPEYFPAGEGYFFVYNPRYTRFFSKPIPNVNNFTKYQIPQAGKYYLAKSAGRSVWIPPYKSEETGQNIISYVTPIYTRGILVGVIGMDMQYSIIEDELKEISLYKTGYAYVLDEDEHAVYHRDYDPGDIVFVFESNCRTFTLALYNGWNLTVSVPKSEINAERNALILLLLGATLIVAGVFILISFRITAHIINPLMELVTATRKLADGDITAKLPIDSDDEIGLLAQSFQETMQRLPNYLYRDSLTGVQNSTAYQRAVEELKKRMAEKKVAHMAVIVFDVNNLKLTNDTYGHEAGNDLITSSSMLICDVFHYAPVFRIGGDEFVAFLEKNYEERESLVAEFKNRLERTAIFVERERLPVSVAVGFAEYDPQSDKSYDDLFNRADEAMYKNKEETKKRLHMPSRSE